ncbi:MAG: hypothetical protein FWC17_00985 [Treponema sp.]|nr:hypothetical protein [Treponema sp.]
MAKDKNAIYAPGELSRVRDKLGVRDDAEAKRMAQVLGGEVGTERDAVNDQAKNKKNNEKTSDRGSKRIRRVDVAPEDDSGGKSSKRSGPFPGDDPSVPARLSYGERIKIDQYAGQSIFEIKNSLQVLTSIFSFFKEPVDLVNQRFVTIRMNEYFAKLERLVMAARNLFPKSNSKRNNQLKRTSPFVYKVLDTIRGWDIETISKNIADLQSRPRSIKVTEFSDLLRSVYKPLFILEELSLENIKSAFKLIYKILYIESPMEAKDKYQDIIRNIIASLVDVRKNVHFGLYPLLMKLISDRFIPYERFFTERRRRFLAFLNVSETIQLDASDLSPQQIENIDAETLQKNAEDDENADISEDGVSPDGEEKEEDPNDPKVIERKAKEEALKTEQKTLEQGKTALCVLFPKAGWDKLEEFPDLYPYFANIYNLRHGYELIAPTDPIQQVSILLHILDDLFIGLRDVSFGIVTGSDGSPVRVIDEIGDTLNSWRRFIEDSFSRDYLPRLNEYCRFLENSKDTGSSYARKNVNELHWIKRLYFLPYYKFESIGPPPFPKSDIIPIYSEVRKLRKHLTSVAVGIEQGIRSGGAASRAQCSGINNPWVSYYFQVPNPISKRMDMMLPAEKKINATLIFFSLSAVTVLDYIINNENSWAYASRPGPLFRSIKGEGVIPQFGVDQKLDADAIFKESLRKSGA